MIASDAATETIWHVAMEQSKYWKNVDPKSCDPLEGMLVIHCTRTILTITPIEMEPAAFTIPGIPKDTSLHKSLVSHEYFAELLKAHRQEYLFQEHGMVTVPLVSQALTDRFSTQVACTWVYPFGPR